MEQGKVLKVFVSRNTVIYTKVQKDIVVAVIKHICDLKHEMFKKLEAVMKEYKDLDAIETRYITEALNCHKKLLAKRRRPRNQKKNKKICLKE